MDEIKIVKNERGTVRFAREQKPFFLRKQQTISRRVCFR
jgi:hypothetical protein